MGDGKRWFKVWTSILSDPGFSMAPLDQRGAWVTLGALVAKHGEKGSITIKQEYLENVLRISLETVEKMAEELNIQIDINDNDTITVTFLKWSKYQVDSTSYERVKKHRSNAPKKKIKNKKKEEDKEVEKEKEDKKIKHIYGELKHVRLTDEDFKKLIAKFGEDGTAHWIKTLDEGLDLKDYKYKSHYRAILNWSKNPANRNDPDAKTRERARIIKEATDEHEGHEGI